MISISVDANCGEDRGFDFGQLPPSTVVAPPGVGALGPVRLSSVLRQWPKLRYVPANPRIRVSLMPQIFSPLEDLLDG